ncbi:BofC C-terminal domain-containing protein [Paenibacillus sp. LHD-117]|uniref:BofC C-terminal domain-containing protein n=1 Tax=Paenibacillus sp. LHD-117 TaxID=3071412 RepID=UPI0027E02AC0|nr:BofC C-terminal domain-containing protein [Paenibacillus sp. LHD-117]MDQ6418609.1 BofC C-terminal domain-containing protein [Paenibacillus sp. LHD-117]
MMWFSLWKQVKKKIRRNRRPLWTLGGFAIMLAIAAAPQPACAETDLYETPSIGSYLQDRNAPVQVKLHRIYVCGEETEPLGLMKPETIIQLLRQHPEWSASLEEDGRTVRVMQQIDDLSSECKSNAYFGMDRNGNFSLFNGEPSNEKVMRTFFQLDVRFMESSLPQDQLDQLSQGIRVSDIDEYNSVLSTYSDYAMETEDAASQKHSY